MVAEWVDLKVVWMALKMVAPRAEWMVDWMDAQKDVSLVDMKELHSVGQKVLMLVAWRVDSMGNLKVKQ